MPTLPYFPVPRPDELLYSVIARYGAVMAYPNGRALLVDLFGDGNVIAAVGFPSRLARLSRVLPIGHPYTAGRLIAEHTFLPYYYPFLSPQRGQQIRADMRGQGGRSIYTRLGVTAGRIPLPKWLRLCPQCVVEDRRKYRDGAYWRRAHQLPGVLLCPDHNVVLINSPVSAYNRRSRYAYIAAEGSMPKETTALSLPDEDRSILGRIARDTAWLLKENLPAGSKALQQRYLRLLQERGLATYSGQLRARPLLQAFRARYSADLLRRLHAPLGENEAETWLIRLFRRAGTVRPPLHHLLLIHFLEQSAQSLFNLPDDAAHFGVGPWPCLNAVCVHYRQAVISRCETRYSRNSRRPVATFACECGFIYTRYGPDNLPADRFRLSRIEAYGLLWEEALRRLWGNPGVSLREMARQLGVDPRTIRRQALRLGLDFPRPGSRGGAKPRLRGKPSTPANASALGAKHRAAWLAVRAAYPAAGINGLRRHAPAAYTWLYRNDREWLRANNPQPAQPERRSGQINWAERDMNLAAICLQTALHLLSSSGKPQQLTKTEIIRRSNCKALVEKHPGKLPLTIGLLNQIAERREEYAVRRVEWAADNFHKAGVTPKRWQLIKQAGVARVEDWPQVKQAIERRMDEWAGERVSK